MRTISLAALTLSCALAAAEDPTSITVNFAGESAMAIRVSGHVFEDVNGDTIFSPGTDVGISGCGVSDQTDVVLTDNEGAFNIQTSPGAKALFCTVPANYGPSGRFYHILPDDSGSSTPGTQKLVLSFPLKKRPSPDGDTVRFVQTTDIHISSEKDYEPLVLAIDEINRLAPAANFAVATGDLTNVGDKTAQFEVYSSGTATCRIPFLHCFGNHDANKGADVTRNYRHYLAPDYYSVDVGDNHLLMLNSIHKSERQNRWVERDLQKLAKGKRVFAFQHTPPTAEELQRMQTHQVRGVFSGHWHSNKITVHQNGLANINSPTFLMGGIDGSPSSFRIVTIRGEQINTEFRFNDFEKKIWISYPQEELTGVDRLLAGIYDTCGGVKNAEFEATSSKGTPVAGGSLKQISPISWMAPLGTPKQGSFGAVADEWTIRVKARNFRGEEWETSARVDIPAKAASAPSARTKEDWPQFMGNAQRTGYSETALKLPLRMRWFTPTHGSIDIASPVLYKGRLAVSAKDRDNLINNGIAIMNAKTGEMEHFVKTDSAVNHSPAFAEDSKGGAGTLYAASMGGTVYAIDAAEGSVNATGRLADDQERWVYSAPATQDNLTVLGSAAQLMALASGSGDKRWTVSLAHDWISNYSSPSFAGDLVIMGTAWAAKSGDNKSIFAVDANTGQLRWSNKCRAISGSISVAPGFGYALDYRGTFKVIDLKTGEDVFTRQLGEDWSMSTPAVAPDLVVVPSGSGIIYAFDRTTLQEKWTFTAKPGLWKMEPYSKDHNAVFSSPTIAGPHVFIGSSDGHLYALDRNTGKEVWSYDLGVPTVSTPCVSGNTLFTAAYDGNVYAFTGE